MFLKRNRQVEERCSDCLNNALRLLLKDEDPHKPIIANAISEICHCISKARFGFDDDVAKRLAETGLCPYKKTD